ncbi:MAG: hypothetical protein AAF802_29170 [Planctomycetota bacterium]
MGKRQFLTALVLAFMVTHCQGQGRTIARLFWQDDSTARLMSGDLKKSGGEWMIDSLEVIDHPDLDPEQQSLVQMQEDDGLLLVGVRDVDDGKDGSGWIAIETGVVEEPHGDHSHWRYKESPGVAKSLINDQQGNPAHVYKYGDTFVIANDKKNGFTITSSAKLRETKDPASAAKFFEGGNGHITLGVIPDQVAYATWIAPAGDDAGRVDVIGLGANEGRSYSLKCPSGTLHGASMNSGRAFFAPADGVCWVDADLKLSSAGESVDVNHLSLGSDQDGIPSRTGAFCSYGEHLVFTSGSGASTKLCWINAAAKTPQVHSLALQVQDGEKLSTPSVTKTRFGDTICMVFGQFKDSPENDRMHVVGLDPNRDGDFGDASPQAVVPIGPNQMVGHAGYHAFTALPDQRYGVVTNPGNGSLWVVSLRDFNTVAKLSVGGTPSRLIAVGG